MRPWVADRLIDTPKRFVGIFWLLKNEAESLTLREMKKGFLSKKLEDTKITSVEELEAEIVKRDGTDFCLLYELEGKASKFVDFVDEYEVQCYFHRSFSNEVEMVFQHFAEKIGGSNEKEAEEMRSFMEQRVTDGMKLPELLDIFEEMTKIPLHCTDELLRVETGIFKFSGEKRFHFDLTRQIPTGHDDEYFQICMSIMYPVTDLTDNVCDDMDSECRDPIENFFAQVRELKIYQQICAQDLKILEVEITVDET